MKYLISFFFYIYGTQRTYSTDFSDFPNLSPHTVMMLTFLVFSEISRQLADGLPYINSWSPEDEC